MTSVQNQRVWSSIPVFMPRAESYEKYSSEALLPGEALSAIYDAVFSQSNASAFITLDCPTGDCEFPLFQLLAFCSHWSDVSHHCLPAQMCGLATQITMNTITLCLMGFTSILLDRDAPIFLFLYWKALVSDNLLPLLITTGFWSPLPGRGTSVRVQFSI